MRSRRHNGSMVRGCGTYVPMSMSVPTLSWPNLRLDLQMLKTFRTNLSFCLFECETQRERERERSWGRLCKTF